MSVKGQYRINGKDLWSEYGVMLEKGSTADLLTLPTPKKPLTYDWEDEDGEEVLLVSMPMQPREVTLKCAIVANSEADFWEKYGKLRLLLNTGIIYLLVAEFKQGYYLYLTECGKVERKTRIKNTSKVAVRFALKFREPLPNNFAAGRSAGMCDYGGRMPISKTGKFLSVKQL